MDVKIQSEEPSSSSQSLPGGFQEAIDSVYSSERSSQLSRVDYESTRSNIGIKWQTMAVRSWTCPMADSLGLSGHH